MQRSVVVGIVMSLANIARADGTVVVGGSPRSIGRAGTGTVGDDGAGALLLDPAAMARRDTTRAEVGVSYVDDAIDWKSVNTPSPVVHDQIGASAMPLVGLQTKLFGWVVGATAATVAIDNRQLRRVDASNTPNTFDYRYTGIGGGIRRDTFTVGAARRFGDAIALGAALGVSRVTAAETRRVWAGFSGIHAPGTFDDDVQLELLGEDDFAPSATLGILVAPASAPVELGLAATWQQDATASGSVSAFGTSGGPSVTVVSPAASLVVPAPLTFRAGARYIADRWIAEVDGDLWVFRSGADSNAWTLGGLQIDNNATTTMTSVTSRLAPRTHAAVRASGEVEIVPGFLWATAGYAFTATGTAATQLSATMADLGGHTIGLGIEGTQGGLTLSLGWSRTWYPATSVPESAWRLDNPFPGGDANVAAGIFAGTVTQFGAMLEVELDAPR